MTARQKHRIESRAELSLVPIDTDMHDTRWMEPSKCVRRPRSLLRRLLDLIL